MRQYIKPSLLVMVCLIPVTSQGQQAKVAASVGPDSLHGRIELTIGNEREEYLFSDVRGLAIGPAGQLIVADYKDHRIKVYAPGGQYLFGFGQLGRGPGDLSGVCCATIDRIGRLWVREDGNRRYSLFQLESGKATHLQVVPMPQQPYGPWQRIAFVGSGAVVHLASAHDQQTNEFGAARMVVSVDGEATRPDILRTPSAASLGAVNIRKEGGTSSIAIPFGAKYLLAVGPEGSMASAVSSSYRVELRRADGRVITTINRRIDGPTLSPKEKDSAEKTLDAVAKRFQMDRSMLGISVPSRKAPLLELGFDQDGRLWVVRAVPDGGDARADLYDAQGRFLGVRTWSKEVFLPTFASIGNRALGWSHDKEGAPVVVMLRFR